MDEGSGGMTISRRGLFALVFGGAGSFVAGKALAVVEPPKPKVLEKIVTVERIVERQAKITEIKNCTITAPMTIVGNNTLISGCVFRGTGKEPMVTVEAPDA